MVIFRLGRSIAQVVPFIKFRQQQLENTEPIITTKLIIIMLMVVIAKIAVLFVWHRNETIIAIPWSEEIGEFFNKL